MSPPSPCLRLLLLLLVGAATTRAQVPACRSNEGEPGRFPTWPVTYDMRSSTIIQPCNMSGFLDAELYSQFGVVSIDWSNAKVFVGPKKKKNKKEKKRKKIKLCNL